MPVLTFNCISKDGSEIRSLHLSELVLAGWTGRDQEAVQHHVEELKALGVAPPSTTPIFYRTGVDLVTQTDRLQVLGPDTSGEVEYVLLPFNDGLWFTVGSDQTDRKAEAIGISLSKQLAGKVFARTAWRLADFGNGTGNAWDRLTIRSWATIDGQRTLYQDATLGSIRAPHDLIKAYAGGANLAPGTVMMSGTPPAIGGIRPATRFEMAITNPATTQSITHTYDINVLDVVS